MPWEEKTVEKSRAEFVREALAKEQSFSEICRKYAITRKTGYKWIERYQNNKGLKSQSKAPFHTPNKTSEDTEQIILKARESHPTWGARKLKRYLQNNGIEALPAHSTITDILKRNNKITHEESLEHTAYTRFVRENPNELWQVDFKGDFLLMNNERCFPLTVLDDHSRYSLAIDAKRNQQGIGVFESFNRIFSEYGLPESLLCDNGNPWGTSQRTGYTKFEVWLMKLNILPIHGRPLHPQTQGKEERFHRTMKSDIIGINSLKDFEYAQQQFDLFRYQYNHERPHDALDLDVPAKHYKVSHRRMPSKIICPNYEENSNIRKINEKGYFSFQNHSYFLSEAFAHEYIEIVPSSIDGFIKIHYGKFKIARIDLQEQLYVSKSIYRVEEQK